MGTGSRRQTQVRHVAFRTAQKQFNLYRAVQKKWQIRTWPNWEVWRQMIVDCRLLLWAIENKRAREVGARKGLLFYGGQK